MKILLQPPFRRDSTPSLALLVAITMLGTMALHMFIPALPLAARDLHAPPALVQMTITLYLIGLAAGQLVYGPVSDRYGRRPLLLGGLVLYVVSSLAAASAGSVGQLIVARVFQSLGACAGLVLGRAMVRDGTSTDKAAGKMAMLMTALTLGPALAPVIGGYLAVWAGWRTTFAALAGGGLIVLVLAALILPETHPHRKPLAGLLPMLLGYLSLLRRPVFRNYVLGGCCVSTSQYAFFAASPFIFVEILHLPPQEVGLYYLGPVIGIALGSFISGRLVRRFGPRTLTRPGSYIQLLGAALLLPAELSGSLSVFNIVGPVFLMAVGSGIAAPNAAALAISADPEAVGAASGLYGSLQMLFGALCTFAVSIGGNPSRSMIAVLIASALIGQAAFYFGGRALVSTAR